MISFYRHHHWWILLFLPLFFGCAGDLSQTVLFEDEFGRLPVGNLSGDLAEMTNMYYLEDAGQKGNWTITSFENEIGFIKAWEVVENNETIFLRQNFRNIDKDYLPKYRHTHPSMVGGDNDWNNYSVRFSFSPHEVLDKCGIMFRYQNDRSYYFFGMEGNRLIIKLINEATAPYRPFEKVLASREFKWEPGKVYNGVVTLRDEQIIAQINDSINIIARDGTFLKGKIGLLSDVVADFYQMTVTSLKSEKRKLNKVKRGIANETSQRIAENAGVVLLSSFSTEGFGSGRSIRFGDLNGDGQEDILIGRLKDGGKKDVPDFACFTAVTIEGELLWQKGSQGNDSQLFTGEVPFQIHDIDADGEKEIFYIDGKEIITLKGSTGKIIRRRKLPSDMGDGEKAIFFCDIAGKGRDSDLVIIEKSAGIYLFNERLLIQWNRPLRSGIKACFEDIDQDGRDEISVGYLLIDENGELLWSGEDEIGGESFGSLIVPLHYPVDSSLSILYAAGDWGLIATDTSGENRIHLPIGNVQTVSVGEYRKDQPGLEIVTSNFWGNQGIINMLNSNMEIYLTIEPGPYGSGCQSVNWKGDGEEYFLLNTSPGDGGMYNGLGELVVTFPDDGHPQWCCAVLDVTGDSRDEVVTWDQDNIWIYTQKDNPRRGMLRSSTRTPLYNYSIYQSNASIPDM